MKKKKKTKKKVSIQFNWKKYGRLLILIDNANIIHAFSTLKFKLDHKKFRDYFKKRGRLKRIYLYTAFIKSHAPQKTFLEMMSRFGITLRTKAVKFIKLKNGRVQLKGDLDIEIAIDMFECLSDFDTAVLLSGDSDFAPLANWLHTKSKKIVVISTRPHISRELVRSADKFIDLGKFRRYWGLKKNHPDSRRGRN